MEELLHLEQHRILGFKELIAGDILRMENEAHEVLLAYARNKGWTKAEIEAIEHNQKYWREKSAEYAKNPEAVGKEMVGLSSINGTIPSATLSSSRTFNRGSRNFTIQSLNLLIPPKLQLHLRKA